MNRVSDKTSLLSPLKRALLALEEMQARLDALERSQSEPIAIVGMACRFPGNAHDPEAFWRVLRDGIDAITEVPSDRWDVDAYYDPDPEQAGKMYTRHGGFLGEIDRFDPQLFGISPREALTMDPQQRLLLEVSWEALENAGQLQDRLAGSQTGVFLGITSNDYGPLSLQSGEFSQIDPYHITGNALNAAAGRLSYTFGFQGPCMAIDTACSSSLVAVHLACRSLSNGECSQALAGGVNLILSPVAAIALSKARVLSPEGRCRAFDAAADGMVRGEGCGMVVLKRLSDAVRQRDSILALIRGSAVNQDGPSSGLTVPNGPAQETVIRRALAAARVDPSEVSYLESHGTGTSLGDPIEVRALGAVFGKDRAQDSPLLIGSVKTNIGHLEASSGIAGLVKVVLALQHQEIPPQLHFERPNPHISWDELPVAVVTKATPWARGERKRMAGVSSFGFSGTNAHVVLEEAPVSAPVTAEVERPLHLMALSARTEAALKQLAALHKNHLTASPDLAPADVCFSANTGRYQLTHRLAVAGASSSELCERLSGFITGQQEAEILEGKSAASPRVAFIFTGQGSQYAGMGHELYRTQPTFRHTLDRCDEILRPYLGRPLFEILYPAQAEDSPLDETACTQPALFALEYALAELWKSWGIKPSAVMGHSLGEYAAACVAGVFSLEDALKLTASRARLMQSLPREGEMASVFAAYHRVAAAILPYADDVSIAALNGPDHTVISGRRQAVQAVVAGLEGEGIKTQTLNVSHAFHSVLMQPMLEPFQSQAREVTYSPPRISLISNVTGQRAPADLTTPDYWCRHVIEPVRFAAGLETLHEQGYEIFVEIGPKPTLSAMGQQCLTGGRQLWLPSLRPGQSDWQQMVHSLRALYIRGVPVDWRGFDRDYARRRVNLPTYPFQRERYWIPTTEAHSRKTALGAKPGRNSHPLLGDRLQLAAAREIRFQSQISRDSPAFLRDHCVLGSVILPATAYLEMVLAAGAAVFKSDILAVKDVVFHQPLTLPAGEERTLQLILSPEQNDGYSFQILSAKTDAADDDISWTLHSSGKVLAESHDRDIQTAGLSALKKQIAEPVPVNNHYQQCRERGIDFGPGFQALEQLWQKQGDALGEIRLPETLIPTAARFKLHPVLLDACLQVLAAAAPDSPQHMHLPVGLDCLRVYGRAGNTLWSHARIRPPEESGQQTLLVDLCVFAPDGQPIASVEGLHLKRASREALRRPPQEPHQDWLYQVEWRPQGHLIRLLPDYLPAAEELGRRLLPHMVESMSRPELSRHDEILSGLESLSGRYVVDAFRSLGWIFQPMKRFSTESIAQELGIVSRHRRLLGRLLDILAEDAVLRKLDGGWEVAFTPQDQDPQAQLRILLDRYPIAEAELTLLGRCGSRLGQALRGECEPLTLLFPEGDSITAARLYQDSPGARAANTLVEKALLYCLDRLPQDRGIRILEIGAGTGGTTSGLLPHLRPLDTEYVFTDISHAFTSRAQEKFSDYPFLRYELLDIEQTPLAQGFGSHQYDLVLAANVLHATRDLRRSLSHVLQLLSPGGMLLLLEGTSPLRFIDLIFGLTEGWWRFADHQLRPTHALLSAARWRELLEETGFRSAVTLSSNPAEGGVFSRQAVVIAQAAELQRVPAGKTPEHWLVFADGRGIGRQLGARLQSTGEICSLVFPGKEYQQAAEREFKIDPTNPGHFRRLLEQTTDDPPLRGVVNLWGLETVTAEALTPDDLEAASRLGCGSTLHLVQSLGKAKFAKPPGLWLVTRGSQPVGLNPQVPGVAQSSLWGMGKTIALEHPELSCTRVDLDPESESAEAQAGILFEEITSGSREDQVAFRSKARYVARLARYSGRHQEIEERRPFRADGTYLITGGLSGLGLLAASWLVKHGARNLVLVGRSEAAEPTRVQLEKLKQAGATVTAAQADVSKTEQVARLLAGIEASMPPLRGIIHSAGVLDDGVLLQQTWDRFGRVMAPKVTGSWNLHTLTRNQPLDFFVMFSSAASLLGSPGQSNHASANAFLDALAHHRRAQGMPGLSINWGAWSEIGAARGQVGERVKLKGMETIAPQQGIRLLEQLFWRPLPQVGVVPIVWPTFLQQFQPGVDPPLMAELASQTREQTKGGQTTAKQGDILRRWAAAAPKERHSCLIEYVRGQVAKVLGLNSAQLNIDQPLNTMGLDSLMAVELRNRIKVDSGIDVPLVKFMEDFSVSSLAMDMNGQLEDSHSSAFPVRASLGEQPGTTQRVNPQEAGRILATLDQLTDVEVDTLLTKAQGS